MNSDDVKTRLLNSAAVTSLASELQIADRFREFGWSTSHGSFFIDPVTDKLRETDVIARRLWKRKLDTSEQLAHLDLIVEVKSIRDYHLVFAPSSFSASYASIEREWIGYASERGPSQSQFAETLRRANVETNDISLILEKFYALAYPGGTMAMRDYAMNPPPAPFAASAFRETNIGGQKDLNASVLWKAIQTLSAFIHHSKTSSRQGSLEFLDFVSDYARLRSLDVTETILDELARMVHRVRLFYPIVVVDSSLWALKDENLEELPWCRFHRLHEDGLLRAWYDIVKSESLDDYLQVLSEHFKDSVKQIGFSH